MHMYECYIISYYSKIELKKNSYLINIYNIDYKFLYKYNFFTNFLTKKMEFEYEIHSIEFKHVLFLFDTF